MHWNLQQLKKIIIIILHIIIGYIHIVVYRVLCMWFLKIQN